MDFLSELCVHIIECVMSHQDTEVDLELSEDEIFVSPQQTPPESASILPKSKCATDDPPGDHDSPGGPEDTPEDHHEDPSRDRPEGEKVTTRAPSQGATAPWGYTRSGKPRKKPLKKLSPEEREAAAEKRRAALEKGRAARTEKILARKRAVMDFFGEDCLQSNTLRALEAAMDTAKSQLKSTQKKIFAKPAKTTVKSERVVGRARNAGKTSAHEPTPEPARETPKPAPRLVHQTAFRPVETPEPIVWRPKPKKKPLWANYA